MLKRVTHGLRTALAWLGGVPGPADPEERRKWAAERERYKDAAMTEADRSNLAGGMRGGPGGESYRDR